MSADTPDIGFPENTDLVWLDKVDSTMDEAARRAPNLVRPVWVAAHRQTGGRGRGGKTWHAPEGNLQATWVAPADRPIAELPLYSFVAAMALRDTLTVWVDPGRIAFKWPNDVLVDGKKVAGILLESSGGKTPWISVGIGVNVAAAPNRDLLPEGAAAPVALADIAGRTHPLPLRADWVLAQLALDFQSWRDAWASHGFDMIRRLWLRGAAGLGGPIRVRLPRETLSGTFENVDADGVLVLLTSEGPRRITAGEVFFA